MYILRYLFIRWHQERGNIKSFQRCTSPFTLLHPSSPSQKLIWQTHSVEFSALGIATTLALCDMAAAVPAVTALLLAFIATLGLGTLGPLIGTAALFEL